jgi:2-polyprenyl-3-methyl-5-hydroxy-6-metoxy-1,4-benzoquinol methylase
MSERWIEFVKKAPAYPVYIGYPMFSEMIKELIDHGKSFIEYGFGTGYTLMALANKGYEVQGYDEEPKLIEMAEGKAKTIIVGDGHAVFTACADDLRPADVVYSCGLLEHYPDDIIIELLERQLELAKSAVVFVIPSDNYPHKEMGDERLMNIAEWEKLLKPIFGDKLIDLHYYCDRMLLLGVIKK